MFIFVLSSHWLSDLDSSLNGASKKSKAAYTLAKNILSAAKLDACNDKLWQELTTGVESYKVSTRSRLVMRSLQFIT